MSSEPTAEELQAKLEAKRAKVPVPEPVQEVQCHECQEWFTPKTPQGNIKLPAGIEVRPTCDPCYQRFRNTPPPGLEPRPSSPVMDGLEGLAKVGANVRRHGSIMLSDIGGEFEEIGRKFVTDVLSAGRYGEVEGLYVHGDTGTGKSQFAVAIMHEFLRMGVLRSHEIVYDHARRMVTQLQDRYSTGGVDEFSRIRERSRLWVYEDAGTEKLTTDAFRVVETIFDAREGHPTIVTSNLSRQQLAERWKAHDVVGRFLSRLKAYGSVRMDGTDRR